MFWASRGVPLPEAKTRSDSWYEVAPIEEAFAKVKALLRKFEARTHEALVEAMGRALDAVTAGDARGFFEHRGYRVVGQVL